MTDHKVFISYSSKDSEVAAAACSALEAAGIRCWIAPRDIAAGKLYGEEIVHAIASSRVVVLVLSASAATSRQVLQEVDRAVAHGLTILPFRIEDVRPTGAMEYYLSVAHWLDALSRPLAPHIKELVRTVQTLLEDPAPGALHVTERHTSASGEYVNRLATLRARRGVASALLGAGLLVALGGGIWWRRVVAARPDPSVVAILPFRVSAAPLRSWATDAVELLAVKFSADAGHRAVDPGTVLQAWAQVRGERRADVTREEKLRLAKSFGAARAILGSIVGTVRHIEMTATLVDVETGQADVTATAKGDADSVGALLDTVAAKLLSHQAGEEQRLYALKKVPIEALKAYLAGQQSYRRGRYNEAVKNYSRALDADSAFPFAALGLVAASNYVRLENEEGERGLRIAWRTREALSARDQVYLAARAGPRYPAISPMREQVDVWERAVKTMPDRAEVHFELGERLFMYGRYVAIDDAQDLARRSFEQALRIDSTFAPALQRLAEFSLVVGDTARAERLAEQLLRADSAADRAGFIQWRVAVSRNDPRELAALRRQFSRIGDASARQVWLAAQLEGTALDDADRALGVLLDGGSIHDVAGGRYVLAMNRGRVGEAVRYLYQSVRQDRSYLLPLVQAQVVRDAIFGSGDTVAALKAVGDLEKTIGDIETTMRELGDLSRRDTTSEAVLYIALCAVEEWRLAHGRAENAEATIKRMRDLAPRIQQHRPGGAIMPVLGAEPVCPAIVEAWSETVRSEPTARAAIDRLDSLMARGPMDADASIGNLVVARWREKQGDLRGALRALRRRPYAIMGLFYLAASLYEEGQMAAVLAERDPNERRAAMRAYRHFLALRSDPDPALRGQVATARAKLEQLQGVETIASRF